MTNIFLVVRISFSPFLCFVFLVGLVYINFIFLFFLLLFLCKEAFDELSIYWNSWHPPPPPDLASTYKLLVMASQLKVWQLFLACLLRFADQRNVTEPHTDGVTQPTTSCDHHVTFQRLQVCLQLSVSHCCVREQLCHLSLSHSQETLAAFFSCWFSENNLSFWNSLLYFVKYSSVAGGSQSCICFSRWRGVTHRKTDLTLVQWHLVDLQGTMPPGHILQEQ